MVSAIVTTDVLMVLPVVPHGAAFCTARQVGAVMVSDMPIRVHRAMSGCAQTHAARLAVANVRPRAVAEVLRTVAVGVDALRLCVAWTLIAAKTRRGARAPRCLGRRQTWSRGTHDEQRNDYGGKSVDD